MEGLQETLGAENKVAILSQEKQLSLIDSRGGNASGLNGRGETRLTATMLTEKLFTRLVEPVESGQREIVGLGIYDHGALVESPSLKVDLYPLSDRIHHKNFLAVFQILY